MTDPGTSAPHTPSADEDPRAAQARAAIEAIWERRRDEIVGRVGVLEDAVTALVSGHLDQETRAAAERDAHRLAGSLGTFGFARGSELAREVEQLLPSATTLDRGEVLRLSEAVVALRAELAGAPSVRRSLETRADEGIPRLLFVGDDRRFAEDLTLEATAAGLKVTAASPGDVHDAMAGDQFEVALLDVDDAGADDGILRLLEALDHSSPPVPTLVLTSRQDLTDRVEMVKRGARGFLTRSTHPAQAIEASARLLDRVRAADTKILAVDDDPTVLSVLEATLHSQGVSFTGLDDPLRFWEVLSELSPDLVILDFDMPRIGGVELCRIVRSDPRWAGLPVLFLTAHSDPATAERIFGCGADDYVTKPVVGPELLTRINNRLERIRLYRSMAETDALTGVATRRKSSQVIDQLARLADRYQQPMGLALIDLDNFKQVNDRHGHAAGDAVLKRLGQLLVQTFRGEDTVARWGGEEFIVGMYGMTRGNGVQRLAELLEAFRRESFEAEGRAFHVTFSAGVAQYPDDGTDLQHLYRAADEALYKAKSSGRDRVLPAGWEGAEGGTAADVVVVDDDAALSELLTHALETRGYSARWIADGEEAVTALADGIPGVKVIVLDVDLPGLNGLAVLRRLVEAGALRRTRVIMLTARSGESEVLEALELGAFDHVAKPFSVPVLIQRIRRAMGG